MQGEVIKVGSAVKVVDEVGVLHHDLVTANWSSERSTCANVVFLSADETKTDQYGRQSEHLSSCSHRDVTTAPGRYWFIEGDVKPETITTYGRKAA
jgi:hypothetical protein